MKYYDITNVVKSVVEAEGYMCWGVEFNAYGKRALLRVFIDHPNGVSLDDCSAVSGQLSAVLDVENCIKQTYTLEVSSPGIERVFFEPSQYSDYIGSKVKVRCFAPIEGRKNFVGLLDSSNEEMIKLKLTDECIDIPIDNIRKARLVMDDISSEFAEKLNEDQKKEVNANE